jgi:hypothetical protein
MPSVPISSVASCLNFGSCKTLISVASFTMCHYTAVRYNAGIAFPCQLAPLWSIRANLQSVSDLFSIAGCPTRQRRGRRGIAERESVIDQRNRSRTGRKPLGTAVFETQVSSAWWHGDCG